jgi:hypothetical protein
MPPDMELAGQTYEFLSADELFISLFALKWRQMAEVF